MNLRLPEPQASALVSLATRTGRTAADLATEAVDRLLAEESWFNAQVQLGIGEIARGEASKRMRWMVAWRG
jgi:predicted transcriptional regulator